MTKINEALDSFESGQGSEHLLITLPALSEALSALSLEDIANTLRVITYGPAEDEHDPVEHNHSPVVN